MVTLRAKIDLGDDCFELRHGFIACQSCYCREKGVNRFLGKRAREFMIMLILPSCAERACILGVIFCRSGFVWTECLVL